MSKRYSLKPSPFATQPYCNMMLWLFFIGIIVMLTGFTIIMYAAFK